MAPNGPMDRVIAQVNALQRRVRYLETVDPSTPSCLLTTSAAVTRASLSNYFRVAWDVEIRDRDGLHHPTANTPRITVRQAGLYVVGGHVVFDSNATGLRGIAILQNGVQVARHQHAAGDGEALSIASVFMAQGGEDFRLAIMQTSGGDLDVLQTAESPFFWAFKIAGG